VTEKTLSFEELGITAADVYEQMGYHDAQPDKATQQETTTILKEVSQWLRPRFSYFVVNKQPDFEMGNIILRQLRGSEAFALFVCTSGLEFETYQQRLKEQGDMVRVFIADALGSVIAEKCADQMEKALQESIDKLGWKRTNRFSPGYCEWVTDEQRLWVPLLGNPNPCGVWLTESALMWPVKSVSGIIGLGEDVSYHDYACQHCQLTHCFRRR
jgi:hypothetical protein